MACGASDLSFLSSSVHWVAHFPMCKTEIHGFPISDSKGMKRKSICSFSSKSHCNSFINMLQDFSSVVGGCLTAHNIHRYKVASKCTLEFCLSALLRSNHVSI